MWDRNVGDARRCRSMRGMQEGSERNLGQDFYVTFSNKIIAKDPL